jgi:hypothetical protein
MRPCSAPSLPERREDIPELTLQMLWRAGTKTRGEGMSLRSLRY